MPRAAQAAYSLPGGASAALAVLGAHLRLARLRRGQSLRAWALRLDVSVPTLLAMERGAPSVGIGVYASALWLMDRHAALEDLAAPAHDAQALAGEVLALQRKGRRRP
jgi:hypothetical protein